MKKRLLNKIFLVLVLSTSIQTNQAFSIKNFIRLFMLFGFGNITGSFFTAQKLKSNSFSPFASNDNKLPNRLKTELTRMESDKNTLDEITKYQSNSFNFGVNGTKLNQDIQQKLDAKQAEILINNYNANLENDNEKIKIENTLKDVPKSFLNVELGESINFE